MTPTHPTAPITAQTPDLAAERLAALRELFPDIFTEGKVDSAKLRAAVGELADDAAERYTFSWAGKRDAIRLLQTPTRATLVPARDESLDFDETQNLFIEGDNLEVLKLLYKPYFGRVKMIYIDPPYNTGNDFVYPDNYADPLATYLQITGQLDSTGNLLSSNMETSGRYHSAWLSMIYPRLFLARQLLTEDGLIFVSIDDHELHDLRMALNEIFGAENFRGIVSRNTGTPTGQGNDIMINEIDYLIVYSRSKSAALSGLALTEDDQKIYDQQDEKGRYLTRPLRKTGGEDRRIDRPSMYFAITDPNGQDVFPLGPGGYQSRWRCGPKRYHELVKRGLIEWKKIPEGGKPTWKPYQKFYLEGRTKQQSNLWADIEGNKKASLEVKSLFGSKVFDYPKPVQMIKRCISIGGDPEGIVLDFFAGSCTTAQAVLELNREDGGNRHFIMVQLPEPTGEKVFPTIADIGKERIRRVIVRMKGEGSEQPSLDQVHGAEDLGFKVLKLAPSHFKPWVGVKQLTPAQYADQMALYNDPLVDGWTTEGVIQEIALKEGYGLGCRVETLPEVTSQTIYRVTDPDREQSFAICLDDQITLRALPPLQLAKDDLFVCRDRALDDEAAANLALQCRLKTI